MPSPSPTPSSVDQSGGGSNYLLALAETVANALSDAFWRFLALFSVNSSGAWSEGLTRFDKQVLSADGAAAVPPDVIRLAKQATFGPTPQVISRIADLGIAGWVDDQFAQKTSTYADLAALWVPGNFCTNSSDTTCGQTYMHRHRVAVRFYANAVMAPDQLRQRVAFALSHILVTSAGGVSGVAGLASYQQILLDNAFGNYRDLLEKVTFSGYMGAYLDMANSTAVAPSENYARELLQLFSMGPVKLNIDGSPQTDASGLTIPNYGTDDIRNVSRALTGWTFAKSGGRTDWTGDDYSRPMVARGGSAYDSQAKVFMGTIVPAGATREASVKAVLDAAFNNASTAPRISKLLIQNLVKTNPSPAYVQRVATVFVDNGAGTRGDLRAVVRAILLDPEARGEEQTTSNAGKVKEPVLVMTAIARAVGFRTDGLALFLRDTGVGEPVFYAPSVFGFFPPDYPLPNGTGQVSPASKALSAGATMALQNVIYDWTYNGNETRADFRRDLGLPDFTGTIPSWSSWEQIGTDLDRLVAVVNLLMLNNSATAYQRNLMKTAAASITDKDPKIEARKRAQALLYIAASSPNFLVDR